MPLLSVHYSGYLAIWQSQDTITLWILIAILFVGFILFVLIKIYYLHIKQQYENKLANYNLQRTHELQLQRATIESIENERKRLGADLHDALLSQLTILRLKLQLGAPSSTLDPILEHCIQDGRRISHDLFPPMLENKSIEELIMDILSPWKKIFHVPIITDIRQVKHFSNEVKLHLIRAVQEICTNISKHANANTIEVHIRLSARYNVLYIADNGIGFTISDKPGIGMQNIHNRIALIHGKYKVQQRPGTRFIIVF